MGDIHNVTVLGTGVLGSQIAFQTAYSGFKVTAYDLSEEILKKAEERFTQLQKIYEAEIPDVTKCKAAQAQKNLHLCTDLKKAVEDADLVIEAIPEILKLKRETYEKLGKFAPEKTIFASNSSTFLPSQMKDFTGRPDRFLCLHFANGIWKRNTAEIMGSSETSPVIIKKIKAFAEQIHMVPFVLKKERSGYLLNALLIPFLEAALDLAAGGFADPKAIDENWKIATGSPQGPFEIYDVVGLSTAYNIAANGKGDKAERNAKWLKENYIDKGHLGVSTGEGFYRYDVKKPFSL